MVVPEVGNQIFSVFVKKAEGKKAVTQKIKLSSGYKAFSRMIGRNKLRKIDRKDNIYGGNQRSRILLITFGMSKLNSGFGIFDIVS